jgi:hypothetical protein
MMVVQKKLKAQNSYYRVSDVQINNDFVLILGLAASRHSERLVA